MRDLRSALVFVLVGVSIAACTPATPRPVSLAATPSSVAALGVAASGDERTRLEAAVRTVDALMAQDLLWNNFLSVAAHYPRIFVGPDFSADGTVDAAGALALLRGRNNAYRMFPVQVTLTGTYYPKGDDYVGTCT